MTVPTKEQVAELVERLRGFAPTEFHWINAAVIASATALEALQAELERVKGDRDYLFENREYHFTGLVEQQRRADAAEAREAKLRDGLLWAMDEIDVLSNKLSGFAYPQGMSLVGQGNQIDNYCKAVDVRRALLNETAQGEQR